MTTALELTRAGWGSYIEAMSRRSAPPESVSQISKGRPQDSPPCFPNFPTICI